MRRGFGIFLSACLAAIASPILADSVKEEPKVSLWTGSDLPPSGFMRGVKPRGDYKKWPSSTDFPPAEWDAGRVAHITVGVFVGRDDHLMGCEASPLQQPEDEPFSHVACAIVMTRGSFVHGLDTNGNSVDGKVDLHFAFTRSRPGDAPRLLPPAPPLRWKQATEPSPIAPDAFEFRNVDPSVFTNGDPSLLLSIDRKGQAIGCMILRSAGTDAGDVQMCEHLMKVRFEPARDAEGHKVAQERLLVRPTIGLRTSGNVVK